MNCFMLRKCLGLLNDSGGEGVDANVRVNCACCGGIVREDATSNEAAKEVEENDKDATKPRESIEGDILRPRQPRRTRLGSCFSCCCKSLSTEGQRMASEAANLHTTSSSS